MFSNIGLYATYGDLFAHPVTFRTYRRFDSTLNFKDYGSVVGLLLTIMGLTMVLGFLGTLITAFYPPYMKDTYHSEELINDFDSARGDFNSFNMSTSNFMPSI